MYSLFKFFFFNSWKHDALYIKLVDQARYFVNNIIYGWNLFLVLINGSYTVYLEQLKK